MENPPINAVTPELVRLSIYTESMLDADDATTDMTNMLSEPRITLETAYAEKLEKEKLHVKKFARRNAGRLRVNRRIIAISYALLGDLKGNRAHSDYQALFPFPPSELIRLPQTDYLDALRVFEGRLAALTHQPACVNALPIFRAEYEAYLTALNDFRQVEIEETQAADHEHGAQQVWRNSYRQVYGELMKRFPDDRDRVESYYLKFSRRSKKEESAQEQTGSETPPPA